MSDFEVIGLVCALIVYKGRPTREVVEAAREWNAARGKEREKARVRLIEAVERLERISKEDGCRS